MAKSTSFTWSRHSDGALGSAYKGYQGADPAKARVIILGKDANFPDPLAPVGMKKDVLDYLNSPASFWKHGRGHHPYNTTNAKHWGVSPIRYHGTIERHLLLAPFPNSCTPHISFVELLWYPSVSNSGNSRPQWSDRLCSDQPGASAHLANLKSWICDESKLVLVPKGVVSLMCDLRQRSCDPIPCVDWCSLSKQVKGLTTSTLPKQVGRIVVHTHFSNAISNAELAKIQGIIGGHIPC